MSHAANLRKYRPQQSLVPSKRRRLSPTASASTTPKINGVSRIAAPRLSGSQLSAVPSQDRKNTGRSRHDEGGVTVRQADDVKATEASEDESASDDDDDDDSDSSDSESSDQEASQNGTKARDQSAEESEDTSESESEPDAAPDSKRRRTQPDRAANDPPGPENQHDAEEPSFGDLLRARASETITIEAPTADPASISTVLTGASANKTLAIPSANSLGTVLAQALKTNDVDLLESCLHVPNLESIRATIERIHPAQATVLLQKLAERLHKRPGRAGSLMVWVQWTVVAHGGYLASQPAAMKELRTLYQVVRQRASGLQPLLALKGKLDMLEAQMQLRRNIQARSKAARRDEEEEGVIYVEGEESDGSSEDDNTKTQTRDKGLDSAIASSKPGLMASSDEELGGKNMSTSLANGVIRSNAESSEDEEDENESDEEDESLIDDEAEDTDNDSDALSEEIDYDDVDGNDEDLGSESEEEDVEPPSKRAKSSKTGSLRRR